MYQEIRIIHLDATEGGGQPRLKEKVAADGNIWHTDMVTILVAGKFCHPKKKTSALSSIGMIIMLKFAWMDNEFSKCIFKDVRFFFVIKVILDI